MERRKFEDLFKQAFEGAEAEPSDNVWAGIERELEKTDGSFKQAFVGAEVNPSDNVWMGIELELEKADADRTRRRLFFYKMLAAASITFAICIAGMGYYALNKRTADLSEQLAAANLELQNRSTSTTDAMSDNNATIPTDEQSNATGIIANKELVEKETSPRASNRTDKGSADNFAINNNDVKTTASLTDEAADNSAVNYLPGLTENTSIAESKDRSASSQDNLGQYANRNVPAFYTAKSPTLIIPKNENEVDAGALLLAKLAAEEQRYAQEDKREKEKTSEKLWTSVGFSAGGFSSVNTGVSPSSSSNVVAFSNSSVPDKQAKASGIAYSVGVNVGTRLSKRWTIQGGVNYLTQSSDYTATNVVADQNFQNLKAESINELDKLPQLADVHASAKLTPTFPYSVNNNVKFFSVPLQAGYLLVNKKFGLQLNAGVSTDLFLENTITPEGGSLNKTTQGRGEDSPYRSVNFSGLMGTEFSYRFGTHYRVSLNPGLRYPLNSVYKSDVGIQSTPLTFDVGLRFRYIFH